MASAHELFRASDLPASRVRASEQPERLTQTERVADRAIAGDRGEVQLLSLLVVALHLGHLRGARSGARTLGVLCRHQIQRPAEVPGRPDGVERGGALTSQQERARGFSLHVRRDLHARRARQVDRLAVVERELLREVRDTVGHRPTQPTCDAQVLQLASGARDLAVRHITDQRVPERVLGLTIQGGRAVGTHQLAAEHVRETVVDRWLVAAAERGERARPEDLADDGGVLQERLVLVRQLVQARADQRLERLGHRDVVQLGDRTVVALEVDHPAVDEQLDELLGEQRIPSRAFDQHGLGRCGKHGALEQRRDEHGRLAVGERRAAPGGWHCAGPLPTAGSGRRARAARRTPP